MANPSGLSFAQFDPVEAFQETYKRFLAHSPGIAASMAAFVSAKVKRPPDVLPGSMRDHHLTGDLAGFRECHLAADILLIYTDKGNIVRPLMVCQHDDLYGPRSKAMKKRIVMVR